MNRKTWIWRLFGNQLFILIFFGVLTCCSTGQAGKENNVVEDLAEEIKEDKQFSDTQLCTIVLEVLQVPRIEKFTKIYEHGVKRITVYPGDEDLSSCSGITRNEVIIDFNSDKFDFGQVQSTEYDYKNSRFEKPVYIVRFVPGSDSVKGEIVLYFRSNGAYVTVYFEPDGKYNVERDLILGFL